MMSLMELQPFTEERVWTADGIPILTAKLTLPEPIQTDSRAARRIRRYYHLQQRAYLRRCEGFLLPRAEEAYQAALAVSGSLPCFRAELHYEITWQKDALLSLRTQARESGAPGQRQLLRWGDTWDTEAGYPLPLTAFFPPRSSWKQTLLACAGEEIRRQESAGVARYHEGARRLLRRCFNPRNYCLTEEGLAFFYPMGSIAPPMEGLPTFTLPWGVCGLQRPGGAE